MKTDLRPEQIEELRYNYMDIRTQPGMEVIFAHADAGYPSDRRCAQEEGLVLGRHYLVEDIDVGQSSSRVTILGRSYNTVLFANIPGQEFPDKIHNFGYFPSWMRSR